MDDRTEYFVCQCGSHDHLLVVEHDHEFGLEFWVQLRKKGFWRRLKYLLGIEGAYSHWCSTMIQPGDVDRLKRIIETP